MKPTLAGWDAGGGGGEVTINYLFSDAKTLQNHWGREKDRAGNRFLHAPAVAAAPLARVEASPKDSSPPTPPRGWWWWWWCGEGGRGFLIRIRKGLGILLSEVLPFLKACGVGGQSRLLSKERGRAAAYLLGRPLPSCSGLPGPVGEWASGRAAGWPASSPSRRPFRFRSVRGFGGRIAPSGATGWAADPSAVYVALFLICIPGITLRELKMSKNKEDIPHELESQFVLRLPPEYAAIVRRAVQSGSVNLKDRLTIELHADGRHGIVRVDRVPLAAKLVDLPCILESLKTIDKKTFYKTADLCQMLVCTVDGELYPAMEEPAVGADAKAAKKKDKDREKKFIWNHGITLPLKNVRKRRFRKTAKKKYIESPDVEKEVKRLLSTDAEAVSVRWEVIAEDETKEADNHGSLTGLDISSPRMSGHKQGHGSLEHDELRELFKDISSTSSDEDERDRHDDEDLNIMDTEEDLDRRLQGKLNESDGPQQENEGANQIAMGIQKQIDNLKGKLQETQERRKRQEDLIMKVENLALKTRLQAVLDEFKQQEEREKQQLASLQEQLETLMEK